jgi:hypothetical protein
VSGLYHTLGLGRFLTHRLIFLCSGLPVLWLVSPLYTVFLE